MRILHVENDTAAVKAAELMLQGVVDAYEQTSLGENAVRMAATGHYDLIVMDVLLPDIDGQEVIRRLRFNGVQTPVLVLSGLVDEEGVFDGSALGAVDTLSKPFNKDSLIGRIRSAIAKSGLSYPVQSDTLFGVGPQKRLEGPEQRRHRRFKTERTARIAQGPGIDCRIVDMSHGGAGVMLLADNFDLPSSFQIELDDKSRYTCRVCWRQGRRLGIKFLGRSG